MEVDPKKKKTPEIHFIFLHMCVKYTLYYYLNFYCHNKRMNEYK